ncbi:MAG TPA: hypothetical protein VFV40_02875 [Nocardioides sp.]|nr:hypothetical protein [Nocardioides sp.]
MTDSVPPPPRRATSVPAPLSVAASLAAVEGMLLVLYGVAELTAVEAARAVMGVTTALFFLVYGAGLVFCAWRMSRRASWARSPVVMAQLIQLGVAWSFRGGASDLVAAALASVAVVVLVGVFHPASLRALSGDEGRTGDSPA